MFLQFTIIASCLFYQDVTLDDYTYPSWALALGWIVVIACLGWLPYIFLVEICRRGTWNVCYELIYGRNNSFLIIIFRLLKKLVCLILNGVQHETNIVNYLYVIRIILIRKNLVCKHYQPLIPAIHSIWMEQLLKSSQQVQNYISNECPMCLQHDFDMKLKANQFFN